MCEPKVSAGVAIGTAIVALLPALLAGTALAALAWVIFTYWWIALGIGLVSARVVQVLVRYLLKNHTVIYWRGANVAPARNALTMGNGVRQSHPLALPAARRAIEAPKIALPAGWSATTKKQEAAR
jgi:hypothetical protein